MPHRAADDAALRTGRAHLAAAEWVEARRAFAGVVAATGSPAAYEGLSWAAWWLDDADAVLAAREEAYRRYREYDDPAGAARMATWLACDHLDFRGATTLAQGWLRRAHRLLDDRAACPEHGWLAFHEGYLAGATGDTATALRLAGFAHDLGERLAIPDLEMLGLALGGSCLVGAGEVADGLRWLDEAQVMTGGADHPIASAWTSCFLVSSCIAVLDLERAAQSCLDVERFAERYGSRYMLAFCRAEHGMIQLWRGEWSGAEEMLEASVTDFASVRPAMVGAPLTVLAELRRRQGRSEDVIRLLDRAGVSAAALECRARTELDHGRHRRALELAERARRRSPPGRRIDRITLLELLVRCRVACGEEPGSALAELAEVGALVGGEPAQALIRLAEGCCAAAEGRHDEARVLLEDAVDGFGRGRAPYDAARARVELATSLLALGRSEQARKEAAAALETLEVLGAEPDAVRARQMCGAADGRATGPPVTRRECDVLALLVEGLTNRQIAARLVVSEHTVHRHVTNILRKLELPSRTAAAAYAVRAGLVAAPE